MIVFKKKFFGVIIALFAYFKCKCEKSVQSVQTKNPNITESVTMSTPSVVDQEMKDLERKDSRNPTTPTG